MTNTSIGISVIGTVGWTGVFELFLLLVCQDSGETLIDIALQRGQQTSLPIVKTVDASA
jgi:hypothetical protein